MNFAKDIAKRVDQISGQKFCYKCCRVRPLEGGVTAKDVRGKPRWVCAKHAPTKKEEEGK